MPDPAKQYRSLEDQIGDYGRGLEIGEPTSDRDGPASRLFYELGYGMPRYADDDGRDLEWEELPVTTQEHFRHAARTAWDAHDAVPVETRRRYLNDAEFHAQVQMTMRQALAEGAHVTTGAIIVTLNALDCAQNPRPEADLWSEWAQRTGMGC